MRPSTRANGMPERAHCANMLGHKSASSTTRADGCQRRRKDHTAKGRSAGACTHWILLPPHGPLEVASEPTRPSRLRTTSTPSTVPLVSTNSSPGLRSARRRASASAERLSPTLEPWSHTRCWCQPRSVPQPRDRPYPIRSPTSRSSPRARRRSRWRRMSGESANEVASSACRHAASAPTHASLAAQMRPGGGRRSAGDTHRGRVAMERPCKKEVPWNDQHKPTATAWSFLFSFRLS